ncbi:murein L,D-transpeptidase [Aliiroseovarius sp. PrR006]|uniref:L,D-transpeptidase family protein n=1 Tax=Aliiroseovarius sp. PrR006 TaxID=2706883 RepID=UPI0013D3DC66|nr:L,D-transpeptidase family protein [Aliiroseovarius sp. PrR006]NDW52134.1 L,D-transpeptidase family protein [Aliiroseovarius sp. PrR006]
MTKTLPARAPFLTFAFAAVGVAVLSISSPAPATAQSSVSAFAQSVAEAAAREGEVAAFYRATAYQPIWTGTSAEDLARRKALFAALSRAADHGLPAVDLHDLKSRMANVTSVRELGALEVELSTLLVDYAQGVNTGILTPSKIDSGIARKVERIDGADILTTFAASSPAGYLKSLPPSHVEYGRLMREKLRLEATIQHGGWGKTVSAKKLKPGQSGDAVIALRNRLVRMGYLSRSASRTYDASIQKAVQQFQADHGLNDDGVAGAGTIGEINVSPEKRLASVLVAMERERWTNFDRGERHVWVNLTDFTAKIVDHGAVTFQTRSVIGKNVSDQRSPEFSDVMEHMVINPTWNVPRSIATKEYLPMLKKNPNAVSHLKLIDSRGRVVSREGMDFNEFTARSFPFAIKQAPSSRNALGLVKFMFPNKHNIYLHDTPSKSLFAREVRAFSHGCIRLSDPFDFAYALLAKQSRNPKATFHKALDTRRETQVDLEQHVPVHIVYRTAVAPAKGRVNYRRDIYGRDAKVWAALQNAGVALHAVDG